MNGPRSDNEVPYLVAIRFEDIGLPSCHLQSISFENEKTVSSVTD